MKTTRRTALNRLTAAQVLKGKFEPGTRIGDGGGLYLNIAENGTRSWLLIKTKDGKRNVVGLGSIHDVSLEKARKKAGELRALVADGIDPKRKKLTFGEAVTGYMAAHQSKWKNPEVIRKRWLQIIRDHGAVLCAVPVANVNATHVEDAVKGLMVDNKHTGYFFVSMIKRTLNWAVAKGHRDRNAVNPANWDILSHQIPRVTVGDRHFASMPFEQVPAFVAALRTAPSVAKLALEFIILTGLRKNEALGLRWTEVNLEAYLAVIPAVRMKGKRDHALPLTRRAHAILTIQHAATGGKGFVFPGEIAGKQLHDTTLRQHVPEGSTVHGFRSSLRDYLGDMTDTPREVAEAILAHRVGNAVEQAYRRGTALDKRGEALRLWQNFIG